MKRLTLTAALLALPPAGALAHPGHLAEVASHNHWLAGAAIAAAAALAAWALLKGSRAKDKDADAAQDQEQDADDADDTAGQEA